MKQRLIPVLSLLLIVLAVPAFAQKVYVDYDKEYDSSKIKTFAWANTPETSLEEVNSLMHNRIINAIEAQIAASGVQKVENDPDVWVTYHTSTSEQLQINTDHWGYGYPGGWYPYSYRGAYWGGGYGTTTTTVSSYTEGTLVIDVWDAETKQLIWRGGATGIVPAKPEKAAAKIDKAIQKIVKRSQKIRAKAK